MKLGFFTMPMHPIGKDWQQSLREDRDAFILADELGYVEGYCGEHSTDPEENITSSVLFMASLISATKNIRLGTGTINMPNHHPAAVASEIAMLDHMLGGRFNLGISPGALPSDAEAFGNMEMNRPAMFLEAINQVLQIWATEPPYNIQGQFWNISTQRTHIPETGMGRIPKPLQLPHPPIVVTAVAPFSQGITEAAARGWDAISANFLLPKWVRSHWTKFVEGCERVGRTPDTATWRVARSVFVADDEATAKAYAMGADGPYHYYYNSLFKKIKRRGGLAVFKNDPNMPDDAVTLEDVKKELVIYGTPSSVVDQLNALREVTGTFGTLLYAGMDWKDPVLARKSMTLLAEKVAPRITW
jgi:alkanesulfonate monooxygenase SsuD/methylene tetrahydromethanopterin reductase-like flavin-dependent oxidoreductase (luciferase family)